LSDHQEIKCHLEFSHYHDTRGNQSSIGTDCETPALHSDPPGLTSSQIVKRLAVLVKDTETRTLPVIAGDIPEDVNLLKGLTTDLAPVVSSVLDAGDGGAVLIAADGPAGLGDPDPFAGANGVDLVAGCDDAVPEGR